jgi:hypothetical protein
MSANHVISFRHPRFGWAGPGLNTVMQDIAGWLKDSRVIDGRATPAPTIYDVNDSTAGHPHVLKVDEFFFEFRMNTGWGQGLGRPVVQVTKHAFNEREHSILLQVAAKPLFGTPKYNMGASDSFTVGDTMDLFGRYLKVTKHRQ